MLANAVIAGVEKAGTTSLFRALSEHPQVAPSSVKETRYFQPLLYAKPLEPISAYEAFFAGATDEPIRVEGTPRYFYGGAPLARAIKDALGTPRIVIVLREPVARFLSFFEFQKARLRIPEDLTAAEYLERCQAMTVADFREPDDHAWYGLRGGLYDEFLPAWHDTFGDDLLVVHFEDLVGDTEGTLRSVATFLGIDPDGYPSVELADENRTTAYNRAGFQRLALAVNDRLERFLRRHYKLKERLRSIYYRINGSAQRKESVTDELRSRIAEAYDEPNARLAAQLRSMGVGLPSWLEPSEVLR